MIYGVIPIGGKGTRLGLPFSKEMLPQKGFSFYNPILDHMVSKMIQAGAETIYFIHGKLPKNDVYNHYAPTTKQFVHITQDSPSFAESLKDFYDAAKPQDDDKILFGLPDSIFEGNLFLNVLSQDGLVAGLFTTLDSTKVDRLGAYEKKFHVKTEKTDDTTEWFWGVLKFTGENIKEMIEDGMFKQYTEIGSIINHYPIKFVWGGNYIDLGTWENLNAYWKQANG